MYGLFWALEGWFGLGFFSLCSNLIPFYKHLKQYYLSIYPKYLIIFYFLAVLTVLWVASDVVLFCLLIV